MIDQPANKVATEGLAFETAQIIANYPITHSAKTQAWTDGTLYAERGDYTLEYRIDDSEGSGTLTVIEYFGIIHQVALLTTPTPAILAGIIDVYLTHLTGLVATPQHKASK